MLWNSRWLTWNGHDKLPIFLLQNQMAKRYAKVFLLGRISCLSKAFFKRNSFLTLETTSQCWSRPPISVWIRTPPIAHGKRQEVVSRRKRESATKTAWLNFGEMIQTRYLYFPGNINPCFFIYNYCMHNYENPQWQHRYWCSPFFVTKCKWSGYFLRDGTGICLLVKPQTKMQCSHM